ncbi:MAG TPA: hypothetical protein VJ021_08295 [Thermoplasmata archaeon]|nr:hypothetical protein [Thermoplasmata archaeon]
MLWVVPFLLVLSYVILVDIFFHDAARWTGGRLVGITILLLAVTFAFSFLWYGFAYGVALILGEFVSLGVLLLLSKFPGLNRHVVVTPPSRPDSANEVWGRFGVLLLILLGFELIFMIVIVRGGELSPGLVLGRPFVFFRDEAVAGLLLAVLLAPVGAFLASRVRTRITDSLEFPLLWLAALLLVVGGVGVLTVEVLPGVVVNPGLFFTSVLFYAPAAWFVALAFSHSESRVQAGFLRRAWKVRSGRFHFGRVQIRDQPGDTTTDV